MILNKLIHKIKSVVSQYELDLLRKRARLAGYELKRKEPVPVEEILIENFFNTDYKKSALLSYIVYPFLGNVENYHSNNKECFTIAEILKELGYNVDVINWNNTTFSPAKDYEVVIDNHNNLQRLAPYLKSDSKKIFHATNAHWLYQNWIEYGRYYDLFLKKGVAITPPRLMFPGNSAEYCDAISMFGNGFTKGTYGIYSSKVHHLPISVSAVPEIINERNYSSAKSKFIWLNSLGALLKGLDIAADAFETLPNCELYICGDLDRENEIRDILSLQILRTPNIKIAGWVDINGEVFRKMATECAWVLGNSFSEGGGGSTLNCMAKGLIPIVSQTSSLDLDGNTGFYLANNTATNLADVIRRCCTLPDAKLKEMSLNVYHFIVSNHTIENFKNKYKDFVLNVVNGSAELKQLL